MNKKKHIYILSLICFLSLIYFLSPGMGNNQIYKIDKIKEANALYEKGDFKGSIAMYETLINSDLSNSALYYNLGNAYFKSGSPGHAILYYERALRISPRDSDIKQNLKYIRSLTVDKQLDEETGIASLFLSGIKGFLSINELTIIVLVFYFVLFVLCFFYIFWNNVKGRFVLTLTGGFILFLFLLSFLFLGIRIYDEEYARQGIVMTSQVKARSGPGEDYTEVFTIHEGSKVFLRQSQGNWRQITLPTGYTGWVKNKSVEEI